MRIKDDSVQCSFHPMITEFLFKVDKLYRSWGDELVITSGSEPGAKHGVQSLHYATPAQAFDLRIHQRANVPDVTRQTEDLKVIASNYCAQKNIPDNWIEVIVESDHIHIEYQPKRQF